ncbi:transcriptional regulator, LacI family protein [Microbacterium sp. HM58-2]|nr:transcriptional regulator, LacI family protein [Microbacterium sp. HM58-2]
MTSTGALARGLRAILTRLADAVVAFPRPAWAVAAVAVVLLVVVILTGGLEPARSSPAPARAGEEVRTPTYAVTVLDAQLTDEIEEQLLDADEGETLLVIRMLLENLSDRPIGIPSSTDRLTSNLVSPGRALLEVHGVDQSVGPTVWRDGESAGSLVLQPGVPSEVAVAWRADEDAFEGGKVTIDVHEAVVRHGAVILSASVETWNAGAVVARVTAEAGR